MPEINIAASFKDGGMLRGLKDLRTVTKGFKGDLEGTSKKLEELSRQKIDIESKLNGARKAAKDFNNVIKQTKGAFGIPEGDVFFSFYIAEHKRATT